MPVALERAIKARQNQIPFSCSNCFTTHETQGHALPATALRMSIDKGEFMWEIEVLTLATSRVRKLSGDHVVGNKEDDIEGLK